MEKLRRLLEEYESILLSRGEDFWSVKTRSIIDRIGTMAEETVVDRILENMGGMVREWYIDPSGTKEEIEASERLGVLLDEIGTESRRIKRIIVTEYLREKEQREAESKDS